MSNLDGESFFRGSNRFIQIIPWNPNEFLITIDHRVECRSKNKQNQSRIERNELKVNKFLHLLTIENCVFALNT